MKVTLAAAEYEVTYGTAKPSASTYTVKAGASDVADNAKVAYGTELTITAVNAAADNKVIVKVNGEDFWETTTANDTKTLTVEANVLIEVTNETVSGDATVTDIKVNNTSVTSFSTSTKAYTVDDLTADTADITMTITETTATWKIYKGAANPANLLASGEGVEVGENGAGITYTLQAIAQSGAVTDTYTVTLEKAPPSNNIKIKATDAATGILTSVDSTGFAIKINTSEANSITVAKLLGLLEADGDAVKSIIVVEATSETDALADDAKIVATNCVLVTAADDSTQEYSISFANT